MAASMSSAHSGNQTTTREQHASLRDYLNTRMAPFLKQAIKQSLKDEPEFPLRYLGEYLINQSLQFEANPQKPEIRKSFQYQFDPEGQHLQNQPGSIQEELVDNNEPYADDQMITHSNETNGTLGDTVNGVEVPTEAPDTEMQGAS